MTLAGLRSATDGAELAAREVLRAVEGAHRSQCEGTASAEDALAASEDAVEAFRRKFSNWPWETDSARDFYARFGSEP